MHLLFQVAFGLFLPIAAASGNVAIIASDDSRNYESGWTSGSNGGGGFLPWHVDKLGEAGFWIGDAEAPGFRLSSDADESSFVYVERILIAPLEVGDTLSFEWGATDAFSYLFNANRGFYIGSVILNGAPRVDLINVNRGRFPLGSGIEAIWVNGLRGPTIPLVPLTWSVTMLDLTTVELTATAPNGGHAVVYRENFRIPGGPVNSVGFYDLAMGFGGYSWFDNLRVTRLATAPTPTPTPTPSPTATPTPTPMPDAPDYAGVSASFIGNIAHGNRQGQLAVTVSKGRVTGQLRIDGRTATVRGGLNAEGKLSVSLPSWIGSQLQLSVEGSLGKEVISAQIGESEEALLRAVDSTGKRNDTFSMSGWRFNVAMVDDSRLAGFASASATAAGVVRLTGRLGDGRPFTASARAVRDSEDDSLTLPVLVRLGKAATLTELWGDLQLEEEPADNKHLTGEMTYLMSGDSTAINTYGIRWQPKRKVNLLSNDQTPKVAFQSTVGEQDALDLEWPANNRLVAKDLGLSMSANAASGAFSGRVRNTNANGVLSGVLFESDMDLGLLGSAVRGVGLFSPSRENPKRVLIEVP